MKYRNVTQLIESQNKSKNKKKTKQVTIKEDSSKENKDKANDLISPKSNMITTTGSSYTWALKESKSSADPSRITSATILNANKSQIGSVHGPFKSPK